MFMRLIVGVLELLLAWRLTARYVRGKGGVGQLAGAANAAAVAAWLLAGAWWTVPAVLVVGFLALGRWRRPYRPLPSSSYRRLRASRPASPRTTETSRVVLLSRS